MMLAAARLNKVTGPDRQPWHLKASFQILDDNGSVTQEGTYEEFWAGPESSKRIYIGRDFNETEYTTGSGDFRATASQGHVPPLLTAARHDLLTPLSDEQTIQHTTYSSKPLDTGKLSLTCISPAEHPGASTFCLEMDEPLLRLFSAGSSTQALYNRILRFGGGAVAGDLELTHGGKVVLSLHIDSLEPLDMNNPAAVTAPAASELVPIPRRVQISGGVAQGMLQRKVAPEYPFAAKAARVTGTVVLQAVIGTDGRIKELQVISGPAVLRKASLDAVRQWRYRPYLLNGAPVEVETTMNVIFALG